jgi:2-polyprenyl-3-methyl-5-hydroxy-6-metoxy-1,4-benzoquinol methylase
LNVLDFGCGTGLLTGKLAETCASVVAVDASPRMIKMLKDKIKCREWHNVRVHEAVLAKDSSALSELEGTIDLVVASSVMTFVPENDLGPTMEVIGRLLKPNGKGVFVHSDWPMSEGKQEKDIMTQEKALYMYAKGGLSLESDAIVTFSMDKSHAVDVFLGVARKI